MLLTGTDISFLIDVKQRRLILSCVTNPISYQIAGMLSVEISWIVERKLVGFVECCQLINRAIR